MKVGIVGNGVVGTAVSEQLSRIKVANIAFDPREKWHECESYIIAVPTPPSFGGTLLVRYVDEMVKRIGSKRSILIKSTLPMEKLSDYSLYNSYNNLCYSPEFLTERYAKFDAYHEDKFVIGGSSTKHKEYWINLFKNLIVDINDGKIHNCSLLEAGLIKLAQNAFLATKVLFATELYNLAETIGIDYDHVAQGLQLDRRLGKTHWKVPGPDGKTGFGGKCLPKDAQALCTFGMNNGSTMQLLETVLELNNAIRE